VDHGIKAGQTSIRPAAHFLACRAALNPDRQSHHARFEERLRKLGLVATLRVLKKTIGEINEFCDYLLKEIEASDEMRACCEDLWRFGQKVEAQLKKTFEQKCRYSHVFEEEPVDRFAAVVEMALKLITSIDIQVIRVKSKVQGLSPPAVMSQAGH
jgi:hypothetical protein